MLLRIGVSNYLSISSRQELSLVASKLKGPENGLVPIPGTDLRSLPGAIIYGANASGKTNFVKAFRFLRDAILLSHARGNPEGGVPRIPFLLNPDSDTQPTLLEADFLVKGVRFQYGFECNDDKFLSEWLYSYPEGKKRKLFERIDSEVSFGQSFKGQKKILVDLMRPNSLFISTATQNDHDELNDIVGFFRKSKFNGTISVEKELINSIFRNDQIEQRTIDFLRVLGTGINGYRQIDIQVPEAVQNMLKEISTIARKHMGEVGFVDDSKTDRVKEMAIEFAHRGAGGEEYYFGLERESSGTRRLILVMNTVFKALDEGGLVIIDELDASLRTLAAEQIVTLFSNPHINQHGAQLIATTHDTNLLNCTQLRRDQIWFCEKDDVGATHVFPLSDIKSRKDDKFEQGYLEGRYGAIPFSGDLNTLLNR